MEQKRQKITYDKLARHKPYKEGDKVWLNDPTTVRKKLAMKWTGPWRVKKIVVNNEGQSGLTYKIKEVKGRRDRTVHYNRLKPYVEPNNEELEITNNGKQRGEGQDKASITVELDIDMDIPRMDQEVQGENKLIDAQAIQETGVRRSKRARGPPERFGELTW